MVYARAFPRLVGFEVPERGPDGLYSIYDGLVAFHVRHRVVKPCAVEVRQVFCVGRASNEESLIWIFLCDAAEDFRAKLCGELSLLETLSKIGQALSTVRRVVHELLVVAQVSYQIIKAVIPCELVVVVERNSEAWRNRDALDARVQ